MQALAVELAIWIAVQMSFVLVIVETVFVTLTVNSIMIAVKISLKFARCLVRNIIVLLSLAMFIRSIYCFIIQDLVIQAHICFLATLFTSKDLVLMEPELKIFIPASILQ